jgi:hypothetical protein
MYCIRKHLAIVIARGLQYGGLSHVIGELQDLASASELICSALRPQGLNVDPSHQRSGPSFFPLAAA